MHGKQIMFIVMENVPCKTKIVLFFTCVRLVGILQKDIFFCCSLDAIGAQPRLLGWVSLKEQECISAASEVVLPWCNGRCCSGVQKIILEHRRP